MKKAKRQYRQRQQRYQQKQKKAFCHWKEPAVYNPSVAMDGAIRLDLMEGMMNIFCKHLVKGMSRDT